MCSTKVGPLNLEPVLELLELAELGPHSPQCCPGEHTPAGEAPVPCDSEGWAPPFCLRPVTLGACHLPLNFVLPGSSKYLIFYLNYTFFGVSSGYL